MAEFDDLLAGIRAHPADELRRLVFADWLDENAHVHPVYGPWASYIRWAINSDRTSRTDPDYWKYKRYPETPPHGVAKLLGADALPVKPKWTGGFPDTFELAHDTLQVHDRKIAAFLGPIRRLNLLGSGALSWLVGRTVARAGLVELMVGDGPGALSGVVPRSLPPLSLKLANPSEGVVAAFSSHDYPKLVGLGVQGLIDPRVLAAAPSLPRLTSFDLTLTGGASGIDSLPPRLPNLTALRLDRQGRDEFLPFLASGGMPRLTALACPPADAETPGWVEFAASPAFYNLTRLSWQGNRSPEAVAATWPDHLREPGAGNLILHLSQIGSEQSVDLLSSPLVHRCACLFVGLHDAATPLISQHCALTADAYLALAENPSARNLKVLSIQMPFKSDPVASGEPFAELCRSPHLAGLTELSLTFHSLTDDDFEELLNATFASNLRYLNLAGSYFSERKLARLLDPTVMPALTWLDVHGPKEANHPLGIAFRERFGPNFAF